MHFHFLFLIVLAFFALSVQSKKTTTEEADAFVGNWELEKIVRKGNSGVPLLVKEVPVIFTRQGENTLHMRYKVGLFFVSPPPSKFFFQNVFKIFFRTGLIKI